MCFPGGIKTWENKKYPISFLPFSISISGKASKKLLMLCKIWGREWKESACLSFFLGVRVKQDVKLRKEIGVAIFRKILVILFNVNSTLFKYIQSGLPFSQPPWYHFKGAITAGNTVSWSLLVGFYSINYGINIFLLTSSWLKLRLSFSSACVTLGNLYNVSEMLKTFP